MRTKQPVRAKRDHFMHRDCVESEALQHNKPLHAKHKQPTKLTGPQPLSGTQVRPEGKGRSPWPSESPTSVLAPGSTPTSPLTLPVAVAKPSLPSTAVWGGHMPMLHLETATAAAKSARGDDGHTASSSPPDAQAEFDLQACLRRASPQVLSVPISEQRCFDGRPFPLTLVPASAPNARWHLAGWARDNRDALLELVEEYDAVLLRGFANAETAEDFSAFVQALRLAPFGMGCSAAPRTELAPGVFTANEAPPQEPIPLHHEMAQCDVRPTYVAFHCVTPATQGGATPIIPSSAVATHLRQAHPRVAERLAAEGVRYVRVLPEKHDPTSPIGKPWTACFETSSRAEAEREMAAQGIEWSWLADGGVRTVTKPLPALVVHQGTGQETFLNAIIAASQGWVDSRNDPARAVRYGGGAELDDEGRAAIADLGEYCAAQQVAFAWRAGDVLLLDNNKALHSRQTYTPPRRVCASLWGAKL